MGQYWLVACPARREYTFQICAMKLGEMLLSSWPKYLIPFLIEPSLQPLPPRSRGSQSSGLRPTKVLKPVNRHGTIQKPAIAKKKNISNSVFGHWYQKRIICVGDYLDAEDLEDLGDTHTKLVDDDPRIHREPLYSLAKRRYEFCGFDVLTWYGRRHNRLEKIIEPSDRILRNLTTKEFIREVSLSSGITLGHVLLLRICWSSDPSTSIQDGKHLTEGDWAGHQFDIVSGNILQQLESSGWKDQSQDIWNDVDETWSSEFGDGWQSTWDP